MLYRISLPSHDDNLSKLRLLVQLLTSRCLMPLIKLVMVAQLRIPAQSFSPRIQQRPDLVMSPNPPNNSQSLDDLNPDERRDWRLLEERLRQRQGRLEVSQRALAEEFHLSPATFSRRLTKFQELGLIRFSALGMGRTAATEIALVGYEDPGDQARVVSLPISPVVGVLALDSPFYLARRADERCRRVFEEDRNSRVLIRLKGMSQSGKSSTLRRLGAFLEGKKGHYVGRVDLNGTAFTPDAFENLGKLLYQFTYAVTEAFKTDCRTPPPDLRAHWRDDIAPGLSCEEYLTEHVFSQMRTPGATLLIDGLDAILGHQTVQTPFCNILRTWNEEKLKQTTTQGRLIWPNIVIAYSTEPYPAYGIQGSVFQNVGIEITLADLTSAQVTDLAQRCYGLVNWEEAQSEVLIKLLGGHPALIQEALWHLSQSAKLTVADLGGERLGSDFFRNHLLRKLELLRREPSGPLQDCFKKILAGEACTDEYAKFQLEKAGLIKLAHGRVEVIELYSNYFGKSL